MKCQFYTQYTVRYDEGDCYGLMKPAAFVRYMQDIAALMPRMCSLKRRGKLDC